MTPAAVLARMFRAAADEGDRIDAELRAERRDWQDQSTSPLGRRRHVAAVRRRVAAGEPGAAMIGRRALLNAQGLAEELGALSKPRSQAPKVETTGTRLERRLGLVGGVR